MKVLVTGGCGFIGSNLVEALLEKGYEVIILDNYLLGRNENLYPHIEEVKVVKGDIRDFALLKELTKDVFAIFNQAASSSAPMFLEDLSNAVAPNVDGFINILNAARLNDVKKVIFASSSSIYGNNQPLLREDMNVVPVNFYASTKLLNEHFAKLFSTEYGIETIGFRYMSVYGPREKSKGIYANLASQFLWKMQEGAQPVIYGDGTQTRDFIFVKDVALANILALETEKKMMGEVFNVGTGTPVSLNELIAILNRILGKNIEPKYTPIPVKNYIMSQVCDISKIRNMLGFEPRYNLEQGIREIITYDNKQNQ